MQNVRLARSLLEWRSVLIAPSLELITQYLACVFGYLDGWIALRSYPESGQSGKPAMQWVSTDENDAEITHQFAITAHAAGRACYLIPGTVSAQGKAGSADVTAFGSILVDIDSGDTEAKLSHLTQYLGQPSMVIESGGITETNTPKMHCYWKLSEPAEGDDIQLVLRLRELIALKAGGDTHFKSAHQPIRIAGSIYHKVGEPKLVTIRNHCDTEYHLGDLIEAVDEMPIMEGVEPPVKQASLNWNDFNDASKPSVGEVLTTTVHEGGTDAWTRFEAISTAIGYFLRRYHEGLLTWDEAWEEISAFNQMKLSPPWDQLRLKREVDRLWKKHCVKNGAPQPYSPPAINDSTSPINVDSYRLADMVDTPLPIPDDIIAPRLLTPGSMLLFAGAPKVGKSDFLLSMFIHFAAGEPFLEMQPHKPLRIFYLQMEIQSYYVGERINNLSVSYDIKQRAGENLYVTPRLKLILNEEGLKACIRHIRERFGKQLPDVICIDPLRNVFDGGNHGGENDNNAMLFFLQERAEKLRDEVNPEAGLIIVHHTKKMKKKQFEEDPFQALSGATALRGYYDTGMILFRPDEVSPERLLITELRNGPEVPPLLVRKANGAWQSSSILNQRITRQSQGVAEDRERDRKDTTITDIIRNKALDGQIFVLSSFAENYRGKQGLGGRQTLIATVLELATRGHIKFIDGLPEYGFPKSSSKWGYLVVKNMELRLEEEKFLTVFPTHYRHHLHGNKLEVENPKIWVLPKESDEETEEDEVENDEI